MDNRRHHRQSKAPFPADRTGYPARVTVYPKPPGHLAKPAYRPLPENDIQVTEKVDDRQEAPLKGTAEPSRSRESSPWQRDSSPSLPRPIISGASPYTPPGVNSGRVWTAANRSPVAPLKMSTPTPNASPRPAHLPSYPGFYVSAPYPQIPVATPAHPCANHTPPVTRQPPAGKRPSQGKRDKSPTKINVEYKAEVIPHVQARVTPNSPYWVDVPEPDHKPEEPAKQQSSEDAPPRPIRGQSYMGLAVVVTVCFNCPVGVIAILTSMSALREFEAGNQKTGKVKATWSLMLSMLGMILTVAIMMTLVYHMAYTDAFAEYGY